MHRQGTVKCSAGFLVTEAAKKLFAVFKVKEAEAQGNDITVYRGTSPLFDFVVGDQWPEYEARFTGPELAISFRRIEGK